MRSTSRSEKYARAAYFGAGLVAGGAVTALALAIGGAFAYTLPVPAKVTLTVAAAAAALLHDLGAIRLPIPPQAHMIPQERFARSARKGGFGSRSN